MNKDLELEEGLKKLKEMIESINICMFLTKNRNGNHVRPMATIATIKVDDNADLLFFTKRNSPKIGEVQTNEDVLLLYSHPGKDGYLNVEGKARVVNARNKIEDLWSPLTKAWFPEGIKDPELTLFMYRCGQRLPLG